MIEPEIGNRFKFKVKVSFHTTCYILHTTCYILHTRSINQLIRRHDYEEENFNLFESWNGGCLETEINLPSEFKPKEEEKEEECKYKSTHFDTLSKISIHSIIQQQQNILLLLHNITTYYNIMVVLPSSSSTSTPTHLIYPSTLPSIPDQLSVLSYNVLLPNSIDGWWNYKMYHPTTSQDFNIETINKISTWEYRSSLIKNKIEQISPDVVCMQEVSPESFHQDFEFMNELGYDGVEMFRRGRFRPATFWKTQKCTLITDAVHKDRTLLTVFQLNGLEEGHPCFERNWHVLNCHLQAGPEGRRRVRQIDEGVKASVRAAKNLKGCGA